MATEIGDGVCVHRKGKGGIGGGGETARLLEGGEHVCSCIISYVSPPSPESRRDQRVCMLYLAAGAAKERQIGGSSRGGGGGEEGRRKEGEKIWNTSSYSSPDPRYGRVSAQARRKKEEGRARMELPGLERITCRSAGDMHLGAKFVSRRCDSIWNQGSRVLCNN